MFHHASRAFVFLTFTILAAALPAGTDLTPTTTVKLPGTTFTIWPPVTTTFTTIFSTITLPPITIKPPVPTTFTTIFSTITLPPITVKPPVPTTLTTIFSTITLPPITIKPPGGTITVTAPAPGPTTTLPASQCNVGNIKCCESVQKADSPVASVIFGLLGISLQDLNVLVGISCSPITVIGGGGSACSANPVCCQNNSFGSLISIGCIPVNISL